MNIKTSKCYKYRPINKYLLDSLVNSELYFGSRTQLNDPFDCNIDISLILANLIKANDNEYTNLFRSFLDNRKIITNFQKHINDFGIASFSYKQDETLMWSHYADDHKGVCIQYDISTDFQDNLTLGTAEVLYEPNRVSDWLSTHIKHFKDNQKNFIQNLLLTVLNAKAPQWNYESEVRVIRTITGVYEVPREIMSQVIFGLQTTEQDKKLIRSIVNKFYNGVRFKEMFRTGNDFGIQARDIL